MTIGVFGLVWSTCLHGTGKVDRSVSGSRANEGPYKLQSVRTNLQRRSFLKQTLMIVGVASASPGLFALVNDSSLADLTISRKKLASMPRDYTGISFEEPQLYNPAYFSVANVSLVEAYKKLSSHGILRAGGHLSDVTRWKGFIGDFDSPRQQAAIEKGKSYWEWKLTDPSVRDTKDGAITPEAIRNLKGFLDATNWRLIYGLCFGSGTPKRARDEAGLVAKIMGDRLLCFQIGNEDDQFRAMPQFRDPSYNFDTYFKEYREFVEAVRSSVPDAKFAGPDVATNMDWVLRFAEHKDNAAIFLSSHFYAMGPAKDPAMNAAMLLGPNERLDHQIEQVQKTVAVSNLSYRMTEGNSCFGGGKPDVSDAFASALWGADYMLRCACAGYCGVNLHGGGDGYYTPIAVGPNLSTELRPLYFGMQFADQFAGAELLECVLVTAQNVTCYYAERKHEKLLALINKSADLITVKLPKALGHRATQERHLSAPSLASRTEVRFETVPPGTRGQVTVPAYTAVLLSWR
jgi:hypothetical protein